MAAEIKTWHVELFAVSCVSVGTAMIAGGGMQFLAALAVILTFGYVQIADRMRESQAQQPIPDVDCAWKLNWYLISKEICWLLLFALTGQWTALLSVPLFLMYPVWRAWWRRIHPREASKPFNT
jgi:hypothetical protein